VSVRIRVVVDQPWDVKADVLAVPVVGEPDFGGPLGELDQRTGGELRALATFGELRTKRFSLALAAPGDLPVHRVLAVAAGDAATIDREVVHRVGASLERRLGGRHASTLAVWLTPLAEALGGADALASAADLVARGVVEGSFDPKALYRDDAENLPPQLDELVLVAPGADAGALQGAAERGATIGEGANLARTLSNRAANDVSPQVLADEASAIAKQHGLWFEVIDERRAAELGMGMFLAVGRGSDNPPRMILMRSGGEGERDALDRHLAIIGKGVCFDSGGISIKPADRMEEMKMDKTGACTVIAAIATVARLAPGTPLLCVAPAVENMPGPHSTRPGDVVKALNGKWVDITNTDAEGRLILGDAMTYAERLGATHLVDVATLTGAVSRALGHTVTGAFANDDGWYGAVEAAAARAGERYWRIPLIPDLWPEMDSWYGDFINSGTAEGSLVKSGLFLEQFATVPWAHLDIGGTGYYRKAQPFAPRGSNGVTHATLVELALAGATAG
jgi:leucyl aminopeptidase